METVVEERDAMINNRGTSDRVTSSLGQKFNFCRWLQLTALCGYNNVPRSRHFRKKYFEIFMGGKGSTRIR